MTYQLIGFNNAPYLSDISFQHSNCVCQISRDCQTLALFYEVACVVVRPVVSLIV